MTHTTPTRKEVAGYAIGSVGTGGFGVLPGLVLSYYLTDTLGVAALMAGLIVTLPKIWDVLIDPFIGRISDAQAARTGTRRPMMMIGAITLPVSFFLVFATPAALPPLWAGVWVVGTFLLATTAFSMFQVPYIALPADLAPTPRTRTAFVAPRIAVLAVAILAFGGGGPVLRDLAGGAHRGYLVMGAITGVLIGAGMILSTRLTTRPATAPDLTATQTGAPSGFDPGALKQAFAVIRRTEHLPPLLTAFVLQALAAGTMLAGAPYLATYILGSEGAASILFVALVAPALAVMPLAKRLADRVGKRRAFYIASLTFALGAGSLMLLFLAPGAWVYASVAIAGVGYAGMQLFPLAMLPDVIAHDRELRGRDHGGIISGVWTAGETTGMALGPTAALTVLALTGFVSSRGEEIATQPNSALGGIIVIMSVLPGALALAALIPLRRYTLTS